MLHALSFILAAVLLILNLTGTYPVPLWAVFVAWPGVPFAGLLFGLLAGAVLVLVAAGMASWLDRR